MKPKILLSFSLLFATLLCGQSKKIALHVATLGQKSQDYRYYHPIEGVYQIYQKNQHFDKKIIDELNAYALIQPIDHIADSSHVSANSLRYYIDPSELVYVKWDYTAFDTTRNQISLDSFLQSSKLRRKESYDRLVQEYFNPFFIKKSEVTNFEYREFIHWVVDSIFREALYRSDEITDEEALSMLAISKKDKIYYSEVNGEWQEIDPADRMINRALFHFDPDFDFRKEFKDERIVPIVSGFYLRPNERWYKRRELDVRKIQYKYYTIDLKDNDTLNRNSTSYIADQVVSIYPDTLGWDKGFVYHWNEAFQHLYFWHPAYDNFPVVNISWTQAKAFCHWKNQQMKNKYPELMSHRNLDLPRTYEYEWAVCQNKYFSETGVIQDNEIITDLLLGRDDKEKGNFFEDEKKYHYLYTEKVYLPCDESDSKCRKWIEQQIKENFYSRYTPSNAEIVRMRAYSNRLTSGIEFLSNNVSEWMDEDYQRNYADLIEAYMNYQCYADVDYCSDQMNIDQSKLRKNHPKGKLIMGTNWFDERYEELIGVNVGGIWPKRFEHPDSSFSTVGFRYVIRYLPSYTSIHEN